MEKFYLKGHYIQLNQLIKALGWCKNGAEANLLIDKGLIKVNSNVEYRKRNKIFPSTFVEYNGKIVKVEQEMDN